MKNKDFVLSPSSLNLFLKEPALWVMKHFYGFRGMSNIYAIRGKFVEKYVNSCLENNCNGMLSFDYFRKICTKDSKKTLEIALIKEKSWVIEDIMVTETDLLGFYKWGQYAYNVLLGYIPSIYVSSITQQKKVKGMINGISMGGYLDYRHDYTSSFGYNFPQIIDLKTCSKLPIIVSRGKRKGMISKTKVDNIRQQVIYQLLTGYDVKLLYVTPTENLIYNVTNKDNDEVMPSIIEGIKKIKKCLTLKREDIILNIRPEKTTSFYWDDTLRQKAKQIWRL